MYFDWKDEFSVENWHLREHLAMYAKEVSHTTIIYIALTLIFIIHRTRMLIYLLCGLHCPFLVQQTVTEISSHTSQSSCSPSSQTPQVLRGCLVRWGTFILNARTNSIMRRSMTLRLLRWTLTCSTKQQDRLVSELAETLMRYPPASGCPLAANR